MGLYLESGYLNQKWIEMQADKNNINFIVQIGGRQVGKTYGTLELMLKENKKFILMRRTLTEMQFICTDINNPFVKYKFKNVSVKKDGKYTAQILEGSEDQIGTVMALSAVAKIRGFDGSIYTDMVFDEFIPENHVIKIKDEGDAFLNALVTVSGNRELEGDKPLRVWMLANANTISSPILEALNIQNKVNQMVVSEQEYSILKDRGIMIIMPKSEELMKKRRETAIMRAVGKESRFTKMAFDNEFSYNDNSNIKNVNIKEYRPVFTLLGKFTFYKHKTTGKGYVTSFCSGACTVYFDTEREHSLIMKKYLNLRAKYIKGDIFFSDLVVKSNFIDLIS